MRRYLLRGAECDRISGRMSQDFWPDAARILIIQCAGDSAGLRQKI